MIMKGRRFLSSNSPQARGDMLAALRAEVAKQKEQILRQEKLLGLASGTTSQDEVPVKPPVPSRKTSRGFMDFKRKAEPYRDRRQRIRDWAEIALPQGHHDKMEIKRQTARCMDW